MYFEGNHVLRNSKELSLVVKSFIKKKVLATASELYQNIDKFNENEILDLLDGIEYITHQNDLEVVYDLMKSLQSHNTVFYKFYKNADKFI